MSLHETWEKVKPIMQRFYWLILAIVLATILLAFWRLFSLESAHTPIKISNATTTPALVTDTTANTQTASVIGSKSGKKYYFPWCGTVKRIKLENQVPFATIELARSAGFTPGGNCKGLR